MRFLRFKTFWLKRNEWSLHWVNSYPSHNSSNVFKWKIWCRRLCYSFSSPVTNQYRSVLDMTWIVSSRLGNNTVHRYQKILSKFPCLNIPFISRIKSSATNTHTWKNLGKFHDRINTVTASHPIRKFEWSTIQMYLNPNNGTRMFWSFVSTGNNFKFFLFSTTSSKLTNKCILLKIID